MLKLRDPGHSVRRGFMLSVGASHGKQLFDGLHLTAKYFFDAVDARYAGSLTYRGVEGRGEIARHDSMAQDVAEAATELLGGLHQRRKVLFAGRQNAAGSQMAAAFTRWYAGDRLDVGCAGIDPVERIDPLTVAVMQEKGIDVAFQKPQVLAEALKNQMPDEVIVIGSGDLSALMSQVKHIQWDLPCAEGDDIDSFRAVRDAIEIRVKALIDKAELSGEL